MTAAAPFPSDGRRPLGEVLVERGILTPDQLAIALEQQRSTGQQLGEIIVASGFAPGPIVAQALATQRGGLIKTEYGFATGWSNDDEPAPVAPAGQTGAAELAERDRTIAELRDWAEKAQAAISSRDAAIVQLRADLAQQSTPATDADDAAHQEELEALRSELANRREETAAARAELEAAAARDASTHAQLEERAAEISRLEAAFADLSAAQTTAEHELASRDEALAALRAELQAESARRQATAERELAATRRANSELERRLENARSRADTLARRVAEQEQELEALRATPAPAHEPNRWASAPMHYVLRRGAGGYDLVAHDGPPPAVGDTVDGLRVARVAPSAPGFEVPCAYLAD